MKFEIRSPCRSRGRGGDPMTETREGTDVAERLNDDDLETITICIRNGQPGRVTPYEIKSMCEELIRLRSENEALKEVLRPFFDGFSYDPGHSDLDNEQPISVRVQLGDWRRARRVLAALSKALGEGQEDNG
jgi:hypothetical protein